MVNFLPVGVRPGAFFSDSPGDDDRDPDLVFCDEGTVKLTSKIRQAAAVVDGVLVPLGISDIVGTVGPDGWVRWAGEGVEGPKTIHVIDLTDEATNPSIGDSGATYDVSFDNLKARGQRVMIAGGPVRLTADMIEDHGVHGTFINLAGLLPSPQPVITKVIEGPRGPEGPAGSGEGGSGAVGPKGDKGDKGEPGVDGTDGAPGADGATGATGAKGDTGTPGTLGAKGDQGERGLTGAKGDTGTTGTAGVKGDTGAQGTAGVKGDTGAAGTDATVTYANAPAGSLFKVIGTSSAARPTSRTTVYIQWQTTDGLAPTNAITGDEWLNAVEAP